MEFLNDRLSRMSRGQLSIDTWLLSSKGDIEMVVIGNIFNFVMDMPTELWQYLFVELWPRSLVFNTLAIAVGGEMFVLD